MRTTSYNHIKIISFRYQTIRSVRQEKCFLTKWSKFSLCLWQTCDTVFNHANAWYQHQLIQYLYWKIPCVLTNFSMSHSRSLSQDCHASQSTLWWKCTNWLTNKKYVHFSHTLFRYHALLVKQPWSIRANKIHHNHYKMNHWIMNWTTGIVIV